MDNFTNLLVIGNGFDISLGLKTSYNDFMKSKWFEEEFDNELIKYLKQKKDVTLWVDIENELTTYSNKLFELKINPVISPNIRETRKIIETKYNNFRGEYDQLCIGLKRYLENIIKESKIEDNSYAYNTLKNSLPKGTGRLYILNFNYTDTVEYLLSTLRINSSKYKINHIHGSLKSDIVFGVEDSANINQDHVFLYKSHSKSQNIQSFFKYFEVANKIFFFGYSLGQTDHSYFEDFFQEQSQKTCHSKEFVFYHYGQEAYDNIIWQLKVLTNSQLSKFKQYNDIKFIDVE